MNDRGRAVVAELQQDELPSVGVHGKADRRRRGRTPVEEERERGSQNDLSHRPVPMRMKRKESKNRSSSQSSSRGITPDPHVKRFNPQTDGLATLYHCLIRLYKTSSDGTIIWNDLRSLYRKDVGRAFNTEELNLICGTTRRTKHQLLQTKLNKLIEPMDTKGLILRIVHTDEGVPVPLPSPIASSDDDASSTLSRMTSTEDDELNKLSMEERRRELTESLIKQGLLKKNGERMSADSPVEETEASIHVEKVDESEVSETEVRERVFNSLMKNFAQIEELEKTLEETDAIQERLEKTLAETNEVEAYIEARRSPSPTASCHTITEEDADEEEPATLSPKRSSIKRKKDNKVNGFAISEEREEIAKPVENVATEKPMEIKETPADDSQENKEQADSAFHISVYSEELNEEEKQENLVDEEEEEVKDEVIPVEENNPEKEQTADDGTTYPAERNPPIKIPTISVTEYFEENTENTYTEDEIYAADYEESAADGGHYDHSQEEDIWNGETIDTEDGYQVDYEENNEPQEHQGEEMSYEQNHNWEELTKNPFIEEQIESVEVKGQGEAADSQKDRGRESPEYDNWREMANELGEDTPVDDLGKVKVPVDLDEIKEETTEEIPEETIEEEEEEKGEDTENKTDDEEHTPSPPQPAPRRSLETEDNMQVIIGNDEKVEQAETEKIKEKFLDHVDSTEVFAELPVAPALYYPEQTPSPSSPAAPLSTDDPFGDFEYTRQPSNKRKETEDDKKKDIEAPKKEKKETGRHEEGPAGGEGMAEAMKSSEEPNKENIEPKDDKENKNTEKMEKEEAGPSHKVEYVPYAITKKTTYSVVEQQRTKTITVCQSLPPENPAPSTVEDEQPSSDDRQPVPVHKTSTIEVELAQSEEEFKDTFGFLESLPSASTSRTNKIADVHVASDVHVVSLSPTRDLEKRTMTVSPVKRKKRWFCRGFCCFC